MVNSINDDTDASLPVDNAPAPWISFRQRLDLTVEQASPAIEEFTGAPIQTWRSDPLLFWQVVHESDAADLRQHLKNSPRTTKETSFRLRNRRSGRLSYVWEIRRPLLDSAGHLDGFECVWLDMTRRILAETRMASACWKETLSSLTLGLTHDFNNLLAGILSHSDFHLSQLDPEHPLYETLSLIKDNSRKATEIVALLHELHRVRAPDHNYLDLNTVTRDTIDILQRSLPRRIQILRGLGDGLMPLYADISELRQAIIHVAMNAADAIPGRGTLTFKTTSHRNAPQTGQSHGKLPAGPCFCLSIQDDGPGIKTRNLPELFSPYYTTKSSNRGTGLGLFQAGHCITNNHGAITVESSDSGATFKLWLPQADLSDSATQGSGPSPIKN